MIYRTTAIGSFLYYQGHSFLLHKQCTLFHEKKNVDQFIQFLGRKNLIFSSVM